VQEQEQIVVELEHDALAEPRDVADALTRGVENRRLPGA